LQLATASTPTSVAIGIRASAVASFFYCKPDGSLGDASSALNTRHRSSGVALGPVESSTCNHELISTPST
jgi:hypothetical protein